MATIKIELTESQARATLKAVSHATKGFFQNSVHGLKPTQSVKVDVGKLKAVIAAVETMIKLETAIEHTFDKQCSK